MKFLFYLISVLLSLASTINLAYAAPSTAALPISPELTSTVNAQPHALYFAKPVDLNDWHMIVNNFTKNTTQNAKRIASAQNIQAEQLSYAGVSSFRLSPTSTSSKGNKKIILYLHGGAYVLGKDLGGTLETFPIVSQYGYTVISPDYRLAPDHPYPAALDDVFIVYKELVKQYGAENIVVLGNSSGAALGFALSLRALHDKIEVPAAIIAGSPWADIDKIGDTYFTHDGIDNALGTYEGLLREAKNVYVGKENPTNPYISPVYADDNDLAQFPQTLIISGTRDLFLSNAARMHKRLLINGVNTQLIVYEAISSSQYFVNPFAPETKEHYQLLNRFIEAVDAKK